MRLAKLGNKNALGHAVSEDTRARLSKANKGYKFTDEQRANVSKGKKGKMPKFIPSTKGLIRTPEHCKKLSDFAKTRTGEKSPRWEGGVSRAHKTGYYSVEYKNWRKAVFLRDCFKCIFCGSDKNLQADHIKQFAFYPELKYIISNGRTLCYPCHRKTETWGRSRASIRKQALQ